MLDVGEATARAEQVGVPSYLPRLSIFQVLLQHPRLARSLSDLLTTLLFEGALDPRLRELMIMRLGWATDSVYEWTQHWQIAVALGIPAEDLVGVRHWRDHQPFGPSERAVLQAVDDTVGTGSLRAETWAALEEHVSTDPAVLLEVVGVVGTWRMVSGLLRSLGVPLEPGVDPWPPDGRSPAGDAR